MPADLTDPTTDEMEQEDDLTTSTEEEEQQDENSDLPQENLVEASSEEMVDAVTDSINETGIMTAGATSTTESSYYYHFWLKQEVQHYLNDSGLSRSERQEDASYQAKELMAWKELAESDFDWSYNEDRFMSHTNRKELVREDTKINRLILQKLRDENDDLFVRHAESNYLRSFIWHEIKDQLKNDDPQEDGEDDNAYEHRLYRQFASKIMDKLE